MFDESDVGLKLQRRQNVQNKGTVKSTILGIDFDNVHINIVHDNDKSYLVYLQIYNITDDSEIKTLVDNGFVNNINIKNMFEFRLPINLYDGRFKGNKIINLSSILKKKMFD